MVKYAPRLIYGTGIADWQERINMDRLRKERADRFRNVLKNNGVSACLITGAENIRYAVGAFWGFSIQWNYCLFFVEHDPILWEPAWLYDNPEDRQPWIKPENYRIAHNWLFGIAGEKAISSHLKAFATEVKQALDQHGLAKEKLGIISFDGYAQGALREQGLSLIDARAMMMEARTIKTIDEINLWKLGSTVTDGVYYEIYEKLKPGMRDIDVKAFAVKYLMEAGFDCTAGLNVWSGPNTARHGLANTDRMIQVGDIVLVDAVAMGFLGYMMCSYRDYIVGRKPNEKEKGWFSRCLDKQNAIIEAIKPGVTTADIAKYLDPADKFNYPEEYYAFGLDWCHGIGLALYEPPIIARQFSFEEPIAIQPGMTIAVETIVGDCGEGGIRLEDHVVVTETGCEIIAGLFPRDELLVACPVI